MFTFTILTKILNTMTQNSLILQNVDEVRLKEIVGEAIREQFAIKPIEEKFLSRAEVRQKLGVCYPTLDREIKRGTIPAHRMGGRILLKESEINLSAFEPRPHKRKP